MRHNRLDTILKMVLVVGIALIIILGGYILIQIHGERTAEVNGNGGSSAKEESGPQVISGSAPQSVSDTMENSAAEDAETAPTEAAEPDPAKYNTTDNWSDDIHFEDSSGRMSGITTETFKLVKYEEGTTTPIQGATFKIKREDNKPFKDGDLEKEITTDEKGEAVVHNLAPGNYVVWEISAPNAYVISNEKYNFTMHREQVTHTFYNKKKDKLDIPVEKVWQDYDNKNNLRPTKLRVGLYANGYEVDSVYLSEDNLNYIVLSLSKIYFFH